MANIGDRRFGYTMQPLDADGRSVHGGNHYANADTIEDARAFATAVLERGRITYCGCNAAVVGVGIVGDLWEFYGPAWRRVTGLEAQHTVEVVRPEPVLSAR